MSLHIFIKGVGSYDHVLKSFDKTNVILCNDYSAQQQVDCAREHWLYKNSEQKVAVVTNSEFFVKEINSLITICNTLSDKQLHKFIANFPVYTEDLFVDRTINITCYCMTLEQDCDLNDFGFKLKLIDDVIDFQNQVQDALCWNDY
jgi:hypothetical protein